MYLKPFFFFGFLSKGILVMGRHALLIGALAKI